MTEYLFVGGPLDGERHRVHSNTNRLAIFDEYGSLVFYYPGTYQFPSLQPHQAAIGITAFVVDGRIEEFANRLWLMAKQPQYADLVHLS